MAEITLEVSETLLRKLKTLAMLSGTSEIESFIVDDIDVAVSHRIVALLGLDRGPTSSSPAFGYFRPADSLSSEPIVEEDETPKRSAPPKAPSHVLSVSDIEADDQVEDPEHEAVSDPNDETTFEDLMGSGELSSEDMDITEPGLDEGENPFGEIISLDDLPPKRIGAKKLPKGIRARVAEYDGTNPVNPERE